MFWNPGGSERQEVDFCAYLVKPDTNQTFNAVQYPKDAIPAHGICMATGKDCQHPNNTSYCSRKRNNDLCDVSWAIKPVGIK